VTSSNAIAGGACTGLGIGPNKIKRVLGIVKAYTTRVGSGPFPTELHDSIGRKLRKQGGEFGATTGRPRRCGWLDTVVLQHSARVNGFTGLAITKLDILDHLERIKICTAYQYKGKRFTELPKDMHVFDACTPVYKEVKGWNSSTLGVKSFKKLPERAQAYIKMIEDLIATRIDIISTGQKRNELIIMKDQF
jgi:adenylosuccinate synthase